MLAISLFLIISAFSIVAFLSLHNREILQKDVLLVVSVIDEARSNTLASVEATTYGVYFDTDSVISFKGATYVGEEDSNEIYELHSKVEISDVALAGGGNEIVFERLTGQVSEVGTVTLSLKDAFDSTLLTISGTGTVASE